MNKKCNYEDERDKFDSIYDDDEEFYDEEENRYVGKSNTNISKWMMLCADMYDDHGSYSFSHEVGAR